jgi:hypothetical protein
VGFKREARIVRLVWPEDHELHGLEVRVKSAPIDVIMRAMELKSQGDEDSEQMDTSEVMEMFTTFADYLVSWNLEDEADKPVPTTLAGIRTLDLPFFFDMFSAWLGAIKDVPKDLGKGSSSGVTFPEASLPMDPLSDARLSLTGHN